MPYKPAALSSQDQIFKNPPKRNQILLSPFLLQPRANFSRIKYPSPCRIHPTTQ